LVDSLGGTNTQSQTLKANGVLGGLQAGYNWQSSIWVWAAKQTFRQQASAVVALFCALIPSNSAV